MVSRANINSEMMKWAREYAGFIGKYENNLPDDIKLRYKSWEDGSKKPTWNQLRAVSKRYNVPTAFFFMDTIPDFTNLPNLVNYRKLDNNSVFENNSPNLIKEIRKSENRREYYLDLLFEMEENIPLFETYNDSINKYHLSNYIREKLEISLDTQKSWIKKNNYLDKKHYNFLNKWKNIITKKMGILIFETEGVSINEMRGLCIFYNKIPIILLNGKDSVNGRIFSLFHELTHLLLGESAICGDDDNIKEEIFCNSVAAEFLVPKEDLKNNLDLDDLLSNNYINKLSHLYGVSQYVIIRRLYDENYINQSDYKLKINDFNQNFVIKGSGGNYFNNKLKYNGEPFCATVLEAYENGLINSGDFTKFTNLNKKFIPQLQKRLYGA